MGVSNNTQHVAPFFQNYTDIQALKSPSFCRSKLKIQLFYALILSPFRAFLLILKG